MAPWAGRRANTWGRRPLLLVGFAALPIRALVFGGRRLIMRFDLSEDEWALLEQLMPKS